MKTKSISGSFGALVVDLDLSKDIQKKDRDSLPKILVKNKVIILKNQLISPEQHKNFAEIFGKSEKHYYYKTPEGVPEVSILESGQSDSTIDNIWHSDGSYRKKKNHLSGQHSILG